MELNKSGAVPDADDTPGALLALGEWPVVHGSPQQRQIDEAAEAGVQWLLGLQNGDGGWPTFCRGWGTMPFDRSGADLTAHVVRALHAWKPRLAVRAVSESLYEQRHGVAEVIDRAVSRGLQFLGKRQQADGSWIPLWFGNQDHPREENPVYGTAKVLAAYRDLGKLEALEALRGVQWLCRQQIVDGGWGGSHEAETRPPRSSVEETALAVEALLAWSEDPAVAEVCVAGVKWLVDAVEANSHHDCSPIGFYFAKLWYYERLYPQIFAVSALGLARRRFVAAAAGNLETALASSPAARATT